MSSQYRQVYHRPGFGHGHGFKPWMPFVFGWLLISFLFWGGFKLLGFLIPLLFVAWVVSWFIRASGHHRSGWGGWRHHYRDHHRSDRGAWDWGNEKTKRKNDWLNSDGEMPTYEAKRKRGEDGDEVFYV
jgi:hypothetical protein